MENEDFTKYGIISGLGHGKTGQLFMYNDYYNYQNIDGISDNSNTFGHYDKVTVYDIAELINQYYRDQGKNKSVNAENILRYKMYNVYELIKNGINSNFINSSIYSNDLLLTDCLLNEHYQYQFYGKDKFNWYVPLNGLVVGGIIGGAISAIGELISSNVKTKFLPGYDYFFRTTISYNDNKKKKKKK